MLPHAAEIITDLMSVVKMDGSVALYATNANLFLHMTVTNSKAYQLATLVPVHD